MSDERKEDLLACLDEWMKFIKEKLGLDSKSYKAYQEIYRIVKHHFNIQQKPEIDDIDAYITEKTTEIFNVVKLARPSFPAGKIDQIITQIISDARGGKK